MYERVSQYSIPAILKIELVSLPSGRLCMNVPDAHKGSQPFQPKATKMCQLFGISASAKQLVAADDPISSSKMPGFTSRTAIVCEVSFVALHPMIGDLM